VVEEPIAISTAWCKQILRNSRHYKQHPALKLLGEEVAAFRWVVVVEQNLVGRAVQLVAQPEQQPYIADNTEHRLRNLHTLRMGLGHWHSIAHTEPRSQRSQ
jgi:adenine-specific DNA methylase